MLGASILNTLGIPFNQASDGWLECSCLYARHKHQGGTDLMPSAKLNSTGAGYRCFACSTTAKDAGQMLRNLRNLNERVGWDNTKIKQALKLLKQQPENDSPVDGQNVRVLEPPVGMVKPFKKFPSEYLELYPSVLRKNSADKFIYPDSISFLAKRQTPLQVIADFDFRWDAKHTRILVPTYQRAIILSGLIGRNIKYIKGISDSDHPKYFDYSHFTAKDKIKVNNSSLVWFRQSTLNKKKPLILVEGMFDAARVYQHYRNVTAVTCVCISSPKLNYLSDFKSVYLIPDNDKAGTDAASNFQKLIPTLKIIKIPSTYKDISDMTAFEVRELLAPHFKLDAPIWTKKDAELYL